MKILLKKSVVFLLLSLCFHMGCFTTSRGDLAGYTEIPNSQILQNYSYNTKVASYPNHNSPTLSLKFEKTPVYQYEAKEYYNEIRTTNKGANAIPNILIYGGSITALTGLVMWVDSSKSKEDKTMGLNLLGGGLIGAIFGGLIKVDENPQITDNKIEGNIVTKNRNGETTSLIDAIIDVKIDKDIKKYTTNSAGIIKIDLIKDYDLTSFDVEKDIYVEYGISKKETNVLNVQSQTVELKSSNWTTKHISILADEIHVYDKPGSAGRKLGVCKKLEKYKVLDSNNAGWIKIGYNDNIGWVSSIAVKTIWIVPTDMRHKKQTEK